MQKPVSLFSPEELDQPPFEGQRSYYVVCSTPRTGSNLLCELLRINGAGVPMEYFHRTRYLPELAIKYGLYPPKSENEPFRMDEYIEKLKQHRTSPNGHFGFKVHWGQFEALARECEIESTFPGLRFIYIVRKDVVAQAVSVSKAAQTKQWNSTQQSINKYEYNEQHISFCIKTIKKSNRKWRQYFAARGINPIAIDFDELTTSTYRVVKDVLSELNVQCHTIFADVGKLHIKKQSDNINREWIGRYLRSHPTAYDS